MFEEEPAAERDVEHVRGEIDVPDRLHDARRARRRGHRRSVARRRLPFNGGVTNRMLARAIDALEEAGVAADAVTSCRSPARSSCRSRRWRSRRPAAMPASSRSGRSSAARRRTSTTSPPRRPPGLQLAGDRDRRSGRVRRPHRRDRRAGRGADRPGRRRRPDRARDGRLFAPASGPAPAARRLVSYTRVAPMSKVCSICGKKPGFGNNRSHSMVATNRRFDPNLQRVRVS